MSVAAGMLDVLNGSSLEAAVRAMAAGTSGTLPVTAGGNAAQVFVDLAGPRGLITLFPGAGVGTEMPKELMKAAISLWKSL